MTSPGLALIIAAWARLAASGPASIRITSPEVELTAGIGTCVQPAARSAAPHKAAAEIVEIRTTGLLD